MIRRVSLFGTIFSTVLLLGFVTCAAQTSVIQAVTAVPPLPNPCPRPVAGSVVMNPPSLFSSNGVLAVRFSYQHTFDTAGRELFCFITPDGLQNPTMYVKPGDHLVIKRNQQLAPGNRLHDDRRAKLRRLNDEQLVPEHSLSRDQHLADLPPG
jgi:hypothetical protein